MTKFTIWQQYSYCKFWIQTHSVNSKFTIWHHYIVWTQYSGPRTTNVVRMCYPMLLWFNDERIQMELSAKKTDKTWFHNMAAVEIVFRTWSPFYCYPFQAGTTKCYGVLYWFLTRPKREQIQNECMTFQDVKNFKREEMFLITTQKNVPTRWTFL